VSSSNDLERAVNGRDIIVICYGRHTVNVTDFGRD